VSCLPALGHRRLAGQARQRVSTREPSGARGPGHANRRLSVVPAPNGVYVYLYHLNYIVAHAKNLKGYRAVPDGLIRIKGTSWN
jgi:hypothetical protein